MRRPWRGADDPASQRHPTVKARRLASRVLPPFVADVLRRNARSRVTSSDAEWNYLPSGWPPMDEGGWDVESVAATQLDRWPAFVETVAKSGPLGQSNEADAGTRPDYPVHNTLMAFGYVLARAAHGCDRISLLDWGGGIGHYCVYTRALMPDVALDYHCRELPRLARAGRSVLPEATFHDSDESALARRYDVVMASSSLQYSRDWRRVLANLAGIAAPYLYVTRMPFVDHAPSFVVVQRPHRHGYLTEYPGWFINRGEFLTEAAELGLRLEREFLVDERPFVPGAPEQAAYRGFLFTAASGSVTA